MQVYSRLTNLQIRQVEIRNELARRIDLFKVNDFLERLESLKDLKSSVGGDGSSNPVSALCALNVNTG